MARSPEQMEEAPDVPVADDGYVAQRTVMTSQGYGVVDGRPYGEQLADERDDMGSRWTFSPALHARLRAATRRALGR